jgi:hypothetical protein
MSGTLHEEQYKFLIISCSVILRTGNVSDKICRENQNTHFVSSNFFSEMCKNIVQLAKPQLTIWRILVQLAKPQMTTWRILVQLAKPQMTKWRILVQLAKPQMTTWRILIACWIT